MMPNTREYKCTLVFDRTMVEIEAGGSVVFITPHRNVTADELSVIASISQLLARLKNGKLTEYEFKPDSFEDLQAPVKCEWLKSGNLKIHGLLTGNVYRWVETVDEAMRENRVFTCSKKISLLLPKHRDGKLGHTGIGNAVEGVGS